MKFIDGKKIVIHNAEFDIAHLNNELSLINREKISKVNVIDTLEIARNKLKKRDTRFTVADHNNIRRSIIWLNWFMFDESFEKNSNLIYQRQAKKKFRTNTRLEVRPFLASREEFFKGAILFENNFEYVIKDNLLFSSNLKYSIADNFDDLRFPPLDVFPAQVRSDVKEYLKRIDDGIKIGRAQFDYHITPKKNNHFMFTAGILEEMFSGIGFEYLFFKPKENYAFGFEVFDVKKRDYDMRFGSLDYRNTSGSVNFYYRNYNLIPFDMEISYGEYLAGDKGFTLQLSRSFINGVEYGYGGNFYNKIAKHIMVC